MGYMAYPGSWVTESLIRPILPLRVQTGNIEEPIRGDPAASLPPAEALFESEDSRYLLSSVASLCISIMGPPKIIKGGAGFKTAASEIASETFSPVRRGGQGPVNPEAVQGWGRWW